MTSVIRVKRKLNEDPADVLVVVGKRLCTGDIGSDEKCFKFAGTLEPEEDLAADHIEGFIKKEKLKTIKRGKNPKSRHIDIISQLRANYKSESTKKRLQFINKHRAIQINCIKEGKIPNIDKESTSNEQAISPQNSANESLDDDFYKLYDVIEEEENISILTQSQKQEDDIITCNGVPLIVEKIQPDRSDDGFVYDLYLNFDKVVNETFMKNICSITKYDLEDLVQDEELEEEEKFDDEDDSNDEDNWRNDYPEEDSDFEKEYDYYRDYADDEICDKFDSLNMSYFDEENECYETASHKRSTELHGSGYASFKARILKEEEDDSDED